MRQGRKVQNEMIIDLWAIDAAGLDVYQFRILVHIGRVGICWKSVRTLADECGISVGKVSEAKRLLIANGHIIPAVDPKTKRMGYSVSPRYERSYSEQERSQDEQSQPNCSPHEQERSLSEHRRSPHELKTITIRHQPNTYIHPLPEPIAALVSAIQKAVKTRLWEKSQDEFESVAYMVAGYDCTPADVEAFGRWWAAPGNGYYEGLPALNSFGDEFPNFLAKRKTKSNGHIVAHDLELEALIAKTEAAQNVKQ